jgi:hypothetical protein
MNALVVWKYAAIPRNMTEDIFLAQILGHKLLGPNASLSVGQSYKDFYVAEVKRVKTNRTCL